MSPSATWTSSGRDCADLAQRRRAPRRGRRRRPTRRYSQARRPRGGRRDVAWRRSLTSRFGARPPLKSSQAPEIFSSFSTRSVGWAPLRSQSTALSLSMMTPDGSWRGLVGADDLDEPAVAGRAAVGGDDAVGRLLLLAHPHEAELHGHGVSSFDRSGSGSRTAEPTMVRLGDRQFKPGSLNSGLGSWPAGRRLRAALGGDPAAALALLALLLASCRGRRRSASSSSASP